jgi:hypothetical protein
MPGKMARSDPQTPFGRLEWRQPAVPRVSASNQFRIRLPSKPVWESSGVSRLIPEWELIIEVHFLLRRWRLNERLASL